MTWEVSGDEYCTKFVDYGMPWGERTLEEYHIQAVNDMAPI